MKGTLQKDEKQQESHFCLPAGTAFSFDQGKDKLCEPAQQKSAAPGNMPHRVVREHVPVEEKQQRDPGEGKQRQGKALFEFEQPPIAQSDQKLGMNQNKDTDGHPA